MDPDRREALTERVRALPKAELHVHLDGSLRPETLWELAAAEGVALPAVDPGALAEYMHVRDARNLEDYLARFELTLSVMQRPDAMERIALELCADAAAENVRWLEIRYSPVLHTERGMSLEEAVEAPLRGIRRAEASLDLRAGLIVCGIRTLPAGVSRELAALAGRWAGEGVVGFDLAGAEAGHPPETHAAAFAVAREAGLGVTVHAGEAAGPPSIRGAVERCGAQRLGHGTRLEEDPALLDEVRERGIALELCLTSNVQTRAVPSFEAHPARRYLEAGLEVSLHTDNRMMSRTTVTRELVRAAAHLDVDEADIAELVRNGFRSAFLPEPERSTLLEDVEPALAAFAARGGGQP